MKSGTAKLWTVIGYILLITVLFSFNASSPTGSTFSDPAMLTLMKVLQAVSVTIVFILPALIYALYMSGEGISFLNLNKGIGIKPALLTAIMILCSLPAINILAEWNSAIQFPQSLATVEAWLKASEANAMAVTEAFMKMDGFGDLAANLIVMALFAAFSEELFFRGILQRVMIQNTGKVHLSIWISAFLFSALHGQFYGLIPRMLLGAVLGYLYYWSGSLWLPVLAHLVNNGTAVKLTYFSDKGYLPESIETLGTGNLELIWFAASTGLTVGLLLWIRKFLTSAASPVHEATG